MSTGDAFEKPPRWPTPHLPHAVRLQVLLVDVRAPLRAMEALSSVIAPPRE